MNKYCDFENLLNSIDNIQNIDIVLEYQNNNCQSYKISINDNFLFKMKDNLFNSNGKNAIINEINNKKKIINGEIEISHIGQFYNHQKLEISSNNFSQSYYNLIFAFIEKIEKKIKTQKFSLNKKINLPIKKNNFKLKFNKTNEKIKCKFGELNKAKIFIKNNTTNQEENYITNLDNFNLFFSIKLLKLESNAITSNSFVLSFVIESIVLNNSDSYDHQIKNNKYKNKYNNKQLNINI